MFHVGRGGCKKAKDVGGVGRDVLIGRRQAWGHAIPTSSDWSAVRFFLKLNKSCES